RLAVVGARLAGKDPHVDEAGTSDQSGGVDALGMIGCARRGALGKIGDEAVLDEDRAGIVATRGGVDDSGVLDEEGGGHAGAPLPSSASSTAMRTATPISTCSVMTDCGPSAMAGSISTPRFIGPGCMTSAPGRA